MRAIGFWIRRNIARTESRIRKEEGVEGEHRSGSTGFTLSLLKQHPHRDQHRHETSEVAAGTTPFLWKTAGAAPTLVGGAALG